jgi:hypothetical protein
MNPNESQYMHWDWDCTSHKLLTNDIGSMHFTSIETSFLNLRIIN